jgi:hypothetical protein
MGTIVSPCPVVFCLPCIVNLVGEGEAEKIKQADQWTCFRCDDGTIKTKIVAKN